MNARRKEPGSVRWCCWCSCSAETCCTAAASRAAVLAAPLIAVTLRIFTHGVRERAGSCGGACKLVWVAAAGEPTGWCAAAAGEAAQCWGACRLVWAAAAGEAAQLDLCRAAMYCGAGNSAGDGSCDSTGGKVTAARAGAALAEQPAGYKLQATGSRQHQG